MLCRPSLVEGDGRWPPSFISLRCVPSQSRALQLLGSLSGSASPHHFDSASFKRNKAVFMASAKYLRVCFLQAAALPGLGHLYCGLFTAWNDWLAGCGTSWEHRGGRVFWQLRPPAPTSGRQTEVSAALWEICGHKDQMPVLSLLERGVGEDLSSLCSACRK